MSLEHSIIAITGANGFVGSCLSRILTGQHSAIVRRLGRSTEPGANSFAFNLSGTLDPAALQPLVRTVIHCAYDVKNANLADSRRINVDGTMRLIAQCIDSDVEHFIFVSSMAAHAGARSVYGQTKWELENRIRSLQSPKLLTTIVKPGTVIGSGGVFSQTRALVRRLPLIPVFYAGGGKLQTVFIYDLCNAIIKIASDRLPGEFLIADLDGVSLTDFYRGVAALEAKRPRLIRFPGNLTLRAVRLFEAIGLKLPITSNNLLGLKHLHYFDPSPSLAALGNMTILNFPQSIERLAREEGHHDSTELPPRLPWENRS